MDFASRVIGTRSSSRLLVSLAYSVALFGLNAWVVRKLFTTEDLDALHSVEGSFITISRFILDHPNNLEWWPLWNAGMPFIHIYFPVLPTIVALTAKLTSCSAALSYHAVTAFSYCLGPVTLFWMAGVISGRRTHSFFGALTYSLLSPSAFLLPAIRDDVGGLWNPERLNALVYYGAGPQIMALSLVPLPLLFLHLAWKHRRKRFYLLSGLSMGLVVLTNAFGAAAMLLGLVCLLLGQEELLKRKVFLTLVIGVLTYVWISPWLPPSLLESIRVNSQTAGGDYRWSAKSLLAIGIVISGFLVVWWAGRRWRAATYVRFFLFFAYLLTIIPGLDAALGLIAIPQPGRYHLEMEMALCLLLPFAVQWLLDRVPRLFMITVVIGVLVLFARQALHYGSFADERIQPVDITATSAYEVANWLSQNFGNQRVMVAGSHVLWFNIFSDTPQFSGGHDQMALNFTQRVAVFTIYRDMNVKERHGQLSVLWLKAFGVQAIHVPGPESEESYKPFVHPDKFEGLLPVIWRENGDTIYRVPQRSASLARVISADAVVDREPEHGLDTAQVERYVAALDDPSLPSATVEWFSFQSARIRATLAPGQVVSVQMNYHPGWRASVNGMAQPARRDGLGLLLIEPDCSGPCQIDLSFDGGFEATMTRWLSILTSLGVLAWLVLSSRTRLFGL